jgi:hypothetical protein
MTDLTIAPERPTPDGDPCIITRSGLDEFTARTKEANNGR